MRKLVSPTGKAQALDPIWPNVGVQAWYEAQLDRLINESTAKLMPAVKAAWAAAPPLWNSHITSGDAKPMTMAAGIAFFCRDKLLLVKRTDGEGWAFPGGHVEAWETFEHAARREAREELGLSYEGHLEPYRLQEYKGVEFATYAAQVEDAFTPTLNYEHSRHLWVTIDYALQLNLHPGVRLTLQAKSMAMDEQIAMDAPSATKQLQIALKRWGTETNRRFEAAAEKIANDFATRNQQATQAAMMGQLKKAGFVIKFKPTASSVEAFKLVAAENVNLIRNLGQKYNADIQQKIFDSLRHGSDLHGLSKSLRQTYDITTRRAALIARDQNNKAKAVMERTRQMELGFKRGVWLHSNAGKVPRPTHKAQSDKPYTLAKGFFDKDENKWVHPGELINCRCTMKPILEGFE